MFDNNGLLNLQDGNYKDSEGRNIIHVLCAEGRTQLLQSFLSQQQGMSSSFVGWILSMHKIIEQQSEMQCL